MVRNLVVQILEQAGYAVLAASNGKDAMEVFRDNAQRIALVLLDLIMPLLSGEEIYRQIKKISPRTPVLFSSGYGVNAMPHELDVPEETQMIRKPDDLQTLLKQVRYMLDAAQEQNTS